MALAGHPGLLGLTQSELTAYLSLLEHNPVNGSTLSRHSGIPRANIYDVLRSLRHRGYVVEIEEGLYAPLPPEELLNRLRHRCEAELSSLEEKIAAAARTSSQDYVWTIRGYETVMRKSIEMISSARHELYVLLYPEEALILDPHLLEAVSRGVVVKYVSMGPVRTEFEYQVIHPGSREIQSQHLGRVFDVVKDKVELLVGLFEKGAEDSSPINWARNHWFVQAIREGIRHDFFHYFTHKFLELGQELTARDRLIFDMIKKDGWATE
ncbi:MAG: helix-turn-helix domain-containing protein [Pseudomonadota bacterium]